MFDEKTILARLQNGEDAQKIADEMAAMINAANKVYTDQKAAEEAAKKQAEAQKKADLQEILDLFADWMKTHYGIDAKGELEANQVIELIDSLQEYVDAIKGLESMLGMKKKSVAPIGTKVIKSNTKPNADDTLNAFLNKMGW